MINSGLQPRQIHLIISVKRSFIATDGREHSFPTRRPHSFGLSRKVSTVSTLPLRFKRIEAREVTDRVGKHAWKAVISQTEGFDIRYLANLREIGGKWPCEVVAAQVQLRQLGAEGKIFPLVGLLM
ncbi:hypothetical protein R1flu_020371 [Riccia fluitans]|uniref:Uncharacterized protein n=1 Tax=Riccia fluitans TaxID=41844 RepID=A0ABD1ZLD6_9MARC